MGKITVNKARGLINTAVHKMTLGKETNDILKAVNLLADKQKELEDFLLKRIERQRSR